MKGENCRSFDGNQAAVLGTASRKREKNEMQELWLFLKTRKKWWLAPILVSLLLLGLLLVTAQGSAVAPFVYTLF
jgi:hypothetical protein